MNKKASKDDVNISVNFLLDAVISIGAILTEIINESLECGVFPKALKQSIIVPIRKSLELLK